MTTAHRPTYNPTKGGSLQGGNKLYFPSKQYSSKDLPGNLTLKKRNYGQGSRNEVKERDFKKELLERERKAQINKNNELLSEMYQNEDINLPLNDTESYIENREEASVSTRGKKSFKKLQANDSFLNKEDISSIHYDDKSQHKFKNNNIHQDSAEENYSKSNSEVYESDDFAPLDNEKQENELEEEGEENELEEEEEDNESEEQEESEDTDEELMREYEKIKKMREEEKKKQEEENAEKVRKQAEEQLLAGNPLINVSGYSLKKKWFEDTVFKNQSKNEPKTQKRFVNDTVRSDFHRKFLNKSVQ